MCVVEPPVIESDPVSMTVNNGTNVTFYCVSFSYANVVYMWLKDTEELQDDDLNFLKFFMQNFEMNDLPKYFIARILHYTANS